MGRRIKILLVICCKVFVLQYANAQLKTTTSIQQTFLHPPQSAKPWVFWYWLHGAVSKAGITADLEAMKEVGIGGAYLMPIKDTNSKIPFQPQVRQLTSEWWALVKFALQEAKRLQLQIGVHVSDGFALAGGPWITSEMSMQKLVWTKTIVQPRTKKIKLTQPEANQNYYKDVAVYAYPTNFKADSKLVDVTDGKYHSKPQFLTDSNFNETYRSDNSCWFKFSYNKPFTLRQIKIKKQNNAYQSQRFIVQASNNGIDFISIDTLIPPRHGWQDWNEGYTHAVNTHTAKYFRLLWSKEGTEPGSEDLDAAKWGTALKIKGIYLSDEPVINNYEAKNGSVWRVAANTTNEEVSKTDAMPLNSIINLTKYLKSDGSLKWTAPSNSDYIIVRIGHTSTGAVNSTAGGGKGLECDKFSTVVTTLQFNNWFNKFYTETDAALAKEVIKVFHVDSWECGSQNWSKNFAIEFKKKRGYNLLPYLLVMTGVPVTDAATSEKILHDVRQTIAELVNDKFYATLKNLAHKKDVLFSAESIAPTFVSDGLMHYKHADIPMGEFWLNSPTHDKPNDMLDAISGAHIYGKNIVQAEAFTTLRTDWGEHPGNLKTLGDRAFAAGINKLSLHVFMHNPWLDKKPGMTLDGIGLFYQRDQTWFKQSSAWIAYLTRCQALLQLGKPVVDIAVFTGEEIPSRSVLPDRLINTLPGLFGNEKVNAERKRLLNEGQPQRTIPDGVTHSANMADPENYIDALNGYQYDCFNPDVLMMMKVKDGRVVLPGGASYEVLVFPDKHPMQPNNTLVSLAVAKKILKLVNDGAKIIMSKDYLTGIGLKDNDDSVKLIIKQLVNENKKGKIIFTPYKYASFEKLGVQKDVEILNNNHSIAWTHRKVRNEDVYFISNQKDKAQEVIISFRITNKIPEIWDAVNGEKLHSVDWENTNGRTDLVLNAKANQSLFVFFKKYTAKKEVSRKTAKGKSKILFSNKWDIEFYNEINHDIVKYKQEDLKSWTLFSDSLVKYYSGTALYTNTFVIQDKKEMNKAFISFDSICNIATIKINGIDCGTLWTAPYQLDITKAIKQGENKIEIAVTNTWHNRLIGDNLLPAEKRITFTNAPYRLKDKPLLPAGIIGEVKIVVIR